MPNHLRSESSPYLLQHVNNPVDWYPWSEAALSLSRDMDRPIFLSIGYSACHWCHVMEHESFENAEIARLMNEWFVCIKVDREERPDLDQIYMNAVQAMTGSGGWPMSVFLTPNLKPFYGGTYWPPTARWGRPGFREILAGVHDAWLNRRSAVDTQADELTEHIERTATPQSSATELTEETLRRAMQSIVASADRIHGGFGSAPKFPHPMDLRLALRCWQRFGNQKTFQTGINTPVGEGENHTDREPGSTGFETNSNDLASDALNVAILTLDKMASGGIYDHLGGGFSRYSTDQRWLVPHFEKMLYDNAQLVPAYLEAYQITGRADFAQVARETLDYVLREMTQPQGGFYSTQDADSEGVEGKFFVWNIAEVDAALSDSPPWTTDCESRDPVLSDDGDHSAPNISVQAIRGEQRREIFKRYYDVTSEGNWEHTNILNRPDSSKVVAAELKIEVEKLEAILSECRKRLFDVRSKRIWPGRDEKVLASWNGLMIGAMAIAANVLNEPKYAQAARSAADFILNEMVIQSHAPSQDSRKLPLRILHSYKDGKAKFNGYLDDYAALIDGLCELYQSIFEVKYLDAAVALAERMVDQFWDEELKGFFYTSQDHEQLIARIKETHDNATPSGNSLAIIGLIKLARLTGRSDLEEKAVATLNMMSGQIDRIPLASGLSLMALDFLLGPSSEIVIALGKNDRSDHSELSKGADCPDGIEALRLIHRQFLPNKVIHLRTEADSDDQIPSVVRPILAGKASLEGKTTLYLCEKGVCGQPIVGNREIVKAIELGFKR